MAHPQTWIPPINFLVPSKPAHLSTHQHVRLLGLCFKVVQMESPLAITNALSASMTHLDGTSIMTDYNDIFSTGDIHMGSDHRDASRWSAP
ncbi:hypothetical protein HPP92_016613 [Vanilla planifolia]|uniref:Uncharacterized protein n=1 Tax=Vanilla planifolia TaxID=51239 RepID=A0A835UQ95_VANPL|nr:hypothetical protein HPP92_016613 [Vanilla planifolia]